MLSFEELVAWWNLSHSLGGHCCTLLGALHGVRCFSQVCMYVRQSSCTLLACLLACTPHSYYYLLLLLLPSFFFVLFCVFFFWIWIRSASFSIRITWWWPSLWEKEKKSPGKKKTVWQAFESASSKTHLQRSVDYYAQQWTGSWWVLFVWIHGFVRLLNSALIWFVQLADCN